MTKTQYETVMAKASDLDAKGESGREWLAQKSTQELSDIKAYATIYKDVATLEYLEEVALEVQNRLGYRISL